MMFNRLRAGEVYSETRQHGHQMIEIPVRLGAGIGVNNTHADADPLSSPRKNPGIARGRYPTDHQYRLRRITFGGVEIVLRPNPESAESRIQPGLLQENGSIARGVNDHPAGDGFLARPDTGHARTVENRTSDRRREPDLGACGDGALSQKLERAAYINDTEHRIRVFEDGRVVRRPETDAGDRMIQPCRNAQGIQFPDKAAPAGSDRGADLVVLLENQWPVPPLRQALRGGKPGWSGSGDNCVQHSNYLMVDQPSAPFSAARISGTISTSISPSLVVRWCFRTGSWASGDLGGVPSGPFFLSLRFTSSLWYRD